eukprot:scaffold58520_cov56-Phaeocystis_antarctica.AAC.4
MACAWHVHGVCMVCAWRVHGMCMACGHLGVRVGLPHLRDNGRLGAQPHHLLHRVDRVRPDTAASSRLGLLGLLGRGAALGAEHEVLTALPVDGEDLDLVLDLAHLLGGAGWG